MCKSFPNAVAKALYMNGINAPPTIAMINNAEAVWVCRPSLSIANGQMPGHIRELDKDKRMMKINDTTPLKTIAAMLNSKERHAQTISALRWEMNFGTKGTPKQ